MTCWNSLPLRGSSAVEEVANNQKNRVNALYHPLSSPIARNRRLDNQEQIREANRQERLRLRREERHSKESDEEHKKRLEQLAKLYQVDIDVLLAEEEEQRQNTEQAPEENPNEIYEEELDDFLTEADLELEAQLKAMNIT